MWIFPLASLGSDGDIWRLPKITAPGSLRRPDRGHRRMRSGVFQWTVMSLVFVASRLLSADHIQGWKSAYTGWWITKPRCPCRSPRTGCSWDTRTSCLTASSIFAILANARSAWCTWGWDERYVKCLSWTKNNIYFWKQRVQITHMYTPRLALTEILG